MDFPSKEAPSAARPLLRPRGAGARDLGEILRRRLGHLWRSRRSSVAAAASIPDRSTADAAAELGVPVREPMMRRLAPAGFTVCEVSSRDSHTLILEGELDAGGVPTLEEAVTRYCAGGSCALTLDLGRLTFIDSSGLWEILNVMRWCERHGHGFALLPGPGAVQEVFEVTGLVDVLPFRRAAPAG